MAEFAVFNTDQIDLNASVEVSTSMPKRGDVVEVQRDGFVWGREESKSQWVSEGRDPASWKGLLYVVKVPGMPLRGLRDKAVLHADRSVNVDDPIFGNDGVDATTRITTHRYQWRINLALLSPAEIAELEDAGQITLTTARFRRVMDNKQTRETFDRAEPQRQGETTHRCRT